MAWGLAALGKQRRSERLAPVQPTAVMQVCVAKPLAFPHEFLVLIGHLDFDAVSVCLRLVRQSLRDRHAIHKYVARRRTPVRNPVLWPTCMLRSNRYFIDFSGDRA